MQNKTVDVIIPTFRPDRKFDILLQRLLSQNVRPRRIIVVNTGEEFWDEEHVREVTGGQMPEVFHVRPEKFDHGGTRHLAIQRSDADVFVCMTQDAVPADKDLIGNLLGMLYSEDHVAAVCARQLPMPDCGIIERYTRQFNYPDKSRMKWEKDLKTMGIKTFFCSNVCAAYRRDIYDRMGGFLRRTIFNEDMIYAGYAIRAGYGIGYCAEARVIHSHNYGAAEQIHRGIPGGPSRGVREYLLRGRGHPVSEADGRLSDAPRKGVSAAEAGAAERLQVHGIPARQELQEASGRSGEKTYNE